MALTHIVGYLLSREFGSGGLVSQSGTQLLVPAFPPLAQITLTSGPFGSDYANIYYQVHIDPRMVPDAFAGTGQYAGQQVQSGIVTTTPRVMDTFLLVTRTQLASITIRNRTNMTQFYGGISIFLVIKTQSNFDKVLEELERVGSSKEESLAAEANQLLASLLQQAGLPRPPIGGNR